MRLQWELSFPQRRFGTTTLGDADGISHRGDCHGLNSSVRMAEHRGACAILGRAESARRRSSACVENVRTILQAANLTRGVRDVDHWARVGCQLSAPLVLLHTP